MSGTPRVVQAKIQQPSGVRMISALQLKNGLSREELTFITIPLVDEQMKTGIVLVEILMNKYTDVMLVELPKSLPPWRGIDHEIELVPRAKPLTKDAYRMAPYLS